MTPADPNSRRWRRGLQALWLLLALPILGIFAAANDPPGEDAALFTWRFDHDLPPDGWGWGDWTLVDGSLEGRHRGSGEDGPPDAYFLPFPCPRDFVMETRVQFLECYGREANLQLLVRNDASVSFESGLRLCAEQNTIVVRHRAWSRDLVFDYLPTKGEIGCGEWHDLRFGFVDGRILAELDGEALDIPDRRVPLTGYFEPHLAVDGARVRFDDFCIVAAR